MLTEWYVGGPLGLQQGFTLAEAPGNREGEPLTLALTLRGDVKAEVDREKSALTLRQPDGQAVLSYRGLMAYDATGRQLHAWLELAPRTDEDCRVESAELLVRVDDRGAQYPVVIDPFIQQAKLTASDGTAGDVFGHSVAISGDIVVVGAPYDNFLRGSVYVFVKTETGWATGTETAKLTASDATPFDQVGYSVDISGDTVVVGALGDNLFRGSVYIFEKPDGGWVTGTEAAKLTSSDGASPDNLGIQVAISGDTIVAGAWRDDSWRGSAYVFVKPETGWVTGTETAKLTASDGTPLDQFGFSVAISGDTLVIGAWRNAGRGAAYVFVKPETGWIEGTETAKLTASDGAASDQFGIDVAINGDIVVVGAWRDDSARGAVYEFVKPAEGWVTATESAKLTALDGAASDHFGTSVDLNGDTVVIGAYGDDSARGSAYVFDKMPSSLSNAPVSTPRPSRTRRR